MKQEHIILSRKTSGSQRKDPFLGQAAEFFQPSFESLPEMEFDLQVESIDKKGIAEMIADPNVSGIAPSLPTKLIEPFELAADQSPEEGASTWGVEVVKATESPFSGRGIKVAVLDTGIDRLHEAFDGITLIEENFTEESQNDQNGHGTHVAGTIFGRNVDGTRIGVANGIENALIGKVLGNGGGSTRDIYRSILWASQEGASIISMSLGIDFPGYVQYLIDQGFPSDLATSRALEGYRANINLYSQLSSLLRAQGSFMPSSLLIAAAGNESKRDIHPDYEIAVAPPATANGVLSVGALGQHADGLKVASFSNTGPRMSAPGVNVRSAKVGGGLVSFNGTSMAAPHVAGVFALWAEKLKNEGRLNHRELSARVEGTTTWQPIANGQDPMDIGAGLVQAPLT